MCTLAYDSIAEAIPTTAPPPHIGVRFHPPKATINPREQSRSSSFDLSWLESLSELNVTTNKTVPLPKFSDFAYVGRVGDGAFAQVYCVQHIASKQHVAIKVADGSNEQARQQLEVERQILFRYSQGNPYMIRAHCTFHQGVSLIYSESALLKRPFDFMFRRNCFLLWSSCKVDRYIIRFKLHA